MVIKSLEEFGLLIKGVGETIKNKAKEKEGGFLSMLLGTLETSLLTNLLAGTGVRIKVPGQRVIRAGEGAIQAGQNY